MGEAAEIVFEGWLKKKGESSSAAYKKRYCVLRAMGNTGMLGYYDDDKTFKKGKPANGNINLEQMCILLENGELGFSLEHYKERSYYFRVDDEQNLADWLDALGSVGCTQVADIDEIDNVSGPPKKKVDADLYAACAAAASSPHDQDGMSEEDWDSDESGETFDQAPSEIGRSPSVVAARSTSYSGYVMKRGVTNTAYQKRWCVLNACSLSYHSAPKKEAKGVIYLLNTAVVVDDDNELGFHIDSAKRTYSFQACTPDERPVWVDKLTRAGASLSNGAPGQMREILQQKELERKKGKVDLPQCQICHQSFGITLLRHYCKRCRKCVCRPCCNNKLQVGGVKTYVCNECFSVGTGNRADDIKETMVKQQSFFTATNGGGGGAASSRELEILHTKYSELESVNQTLQWNLEETSSMLDQKNTENLNLKGQIEQLTRANEELKAKIEQLSFGVKATRGVSEDVRSPPEWVDNDEADECMACELPFSALRRRHHCRRCGQLFCDACSKHRSTLPEFGKSRDPKGKPFTKPVRVCLDCFAASPM